MPPKRKVSRSLPATMTWAGRWERIKRHKVIQWTVAYGAGAFMVLQLIDLVSDDLWIVHTSVMAMALVALLVATIAWYHGHRGLQHISGPELLILALLLFVIGGALWIRYDGTQPRPTRSPEVANAASVPAAGRLAGKKVVVLAVMSGGAAYEQIILNAFRQHARQRIEAEGGRLEWKVPKDGYNVSPSHADGKQRWSSLAENIRRLYSDVDYLVGVGTFASTALKEHELVEKLGADGLIFLGVTDPVGARLVEGLKPRAESVAIAGVRYGRGGAAYGQYLADLFPRDQKLVFVRHADTPQDRYMATELTRTGRVTDYVYTGELDVGALDDPDAIYFAWYGFDNVLADETKDATLLLNQKVVPSTCTEELLRGAGIVVSVNDHQVGVAGAELMLSAVLDDRIQLGHLPVRDVDFRHWVNWETVRRKDIELKVPRDPTKGDDTCPDDIS